MSARRLALSWWLVCALPVAAACSMRDVDYLSADRDVGPAHVAGAAGANQSDATPIARGGSSAAGAAGSGHAAASGDAGSNTGGTGAGGDNSAAAGGGGEECAWYPDADRDGFGDASAEASCREGPGFVDNDFDCDDSDYEVSPAAIELCDGVDTDCDARTREECFERCTPMLYAGHKYMVCLEVAPYWLAAGVCAAEGMWLLRIDDSDENAHFTQAMQGARAWVGGTDLWMERTWEWGDGDVFFRNGSRVSGRYSNFAAGEPTNSNGSEHCLELRGDGSWNDHACDVNHSFICERY